MLKEVGRNSLVAKISPVYHDHVFLTLQNPASGQIIVKTGDILGICQESLLAPARVSHPLMNEAPGQQQAANIPVFIKKSDFTCDDNNVYCGFASLGRGKIDYKNCLMKVSLRPEYEKKFKLVKSHLTVQIKNSIWMEMECGRGVFERTHLKDGCIGVASSIMDDIGVQYLLSKIPTNQIRSMRIDSNDDSNVENNQEVENAYDEMLSQIDNDMKVNTVSPRKTLKYVESLLDRTYKGVVGVDVLDIPPKGEIKTYLYLQDDDLHLDLKHRNNMKQVQVIAMNRPFLQEMVDQFSLCPLLGLDYVVEILAGHLEPSYHCAVCSVDITMSDLMHHLTSLNHVLTFIKEFFKVAWARFSTQHLAE